MYAIDMSLRLPKLGRFIRWAASALEGLLTSFVGGVSTVDSRGDWLVQFYKSWNQNVQVIWNVPSRLDDPSEEEVAALRGEYFRLKVVAFVGGLKKKKGFHLAIEVAAAVKKRHSDALFLFIGAKENEEESVQSLIEAHGLKGSIRVLKWMPYRLMLAHLRHAQIGLALHRREAIYPFVSAGNGRKFFSYMQAGVPIIGPNFGEVGQTVTIADCGLLVDTENANEVSRAIIELLDRTDEASRMAANGRRAFLKFFNWEREEKKFVDLVDKITLLRISQPGC
jgi:glycosyltransferase involved in cell wall biosynthesis